MAKKNINEPTEISYAELGDDAKKFIGDVNEFESSQNKHLAEKEEKTRLGGISSAIVELLSGTAVNPALIKVLTDYYDRAMDTPVLSKEELAHHADKALASATAIKMSMEVIDKAIANGVVYFSLITEKRCLSASELFNSYDVEGGLHFCSALSAKTGESETNMYYAHFFYINPISADVVADSNPAQLSDFKWAEFHDLLPTLFRKEQ